MQTDPFAKISFDETPRNHRADMKAALASVRAEIGRLDAIVAAFETVRQSALRTRDGNRKKQIGRAHV